MASKRSNQAKRWGLMRCSRAAAQREASEAKREERAGWRRHVAPWAASRGPQQPVIKPVIAVVVVRKHDAEAAAALSSRFLFV